jgi:Rod binding domain-containing protein
MEAALPAFSSLAAPAARRVGGEAQAMEVAGEFEAAFLSSYLKTMFEGIGDDPMSGGSGAKSWRELLVDEYATSMTARGGIGLAEPIAAELLRFQEANPA